MSSKVYTSVDIPPFYVNSLIVESSLSIKILVLFAAYSDIVNTRTNDKIAPNVVLNDPPPFSLKPISYGNRSIL